MLQGPTMRSGRCRARAMACSAITMSARFSPSDSGGADSPPSSAAAAAAASPSSPAGICPRGTLLYSREVGPARDSPRRHRYAF